MIVLRTCTVIIGVGVALAFQGSVISLDGRFNERKGDFPWLVEFYAPWCGHCKKLQPIFERVAAELAATDIHVAKLDATLHSSVSAAYDVRGYPTVKFIKGDRSLTYSGDRSVEGLKKFAIRANRPGIANINDLNSFLFLTHGADPFFAYAGEKGDTLYAAYSIVAEKFVVQADFFELPQAIASMLSLYLACSVSRSAAFNTKSFLSVDRLSVDEFLVSGLAAASLKDLMTKPEVKDLLLEHVPSIIVFKDRQQYIFNSNGVEEQSAIADALERWVNQERFSLVQPVRPSGFHELTTLDKQLVILVTNDHDLAADVSSRAVDMFSRVARDWKASTSSTKYQFVSMEDPEIVANILMGAPQLPFLLVFDPVDNTYFLPNLTSHPTGQLPFSDDRDLTSFLQDIIEGKIQVHGGNGLVQRIRRLVHEIVSLVVSIWLESRFLFIIIICMPVFIVCMIIYTICCMSWGGEDGDEDEISAESIAASELSENVGHAKIE